jgi:hypothetical protein
MSWCIADVLIGWCTMVEMKRHENKGNRLYVPHSIAEASGCWLLLLLLLPLDPALEMVQV